MLRALGRDAGARTALEQADAWHRAAGGGEQADLGECLLAAMGADGPRADAELKLTVLLAEAQRDDLAHVEDFALDALACMAADAGDLARSRELCATADRRLEDAAHFITDLDRVDARYVRELV